MISSNSSVFGAGVGLDWCGVDWGFRGLGSGGFDAGALRRERER